MIRYDYRCSKCGSVSEVMLSIKSDPACCLDCPNCQAAKSMHRLMGAGQDGFSGNLAMAAKYPVVSNQLPFELPDCPHSGPLKKSVITSREHERKVYDRLQMVRG